MTFCEDMRPIGAPLLGSRIISSDFSGLMCKSHNRRGVRNSQCAAGLLLTHFIASHFKNAGSSSSP